MRIWDLSAGYLNRQSLLGEHRELHGIASILTHGRTGYARHPETRRWARARTGLALRHRQLAAEMQLRGYTDHTPLACRRLDATWPASFVTDPGEQIMLLRRKYAGTDKGRIPLPRTPQELWAQHKYSVMARRPESYKTLGRTVARLRPRAPLRELARDLIEILRERPKEGQLVNAIEHMWGHVREHAPAGERLIVLASTAHLLECTQRLAWQVGERYLLSSTALSELAVFVGPITSPSAS